MTGKKKASSGTWVEKELWESKAFCSLQGFAPQLLLFFFGKRQFQTYGRTGKQKRVCVNCPKINLTYVEMKRYGITQPRITRAINQLLEKGFISVVNPGGGYNQDKAIYALIDKWRIWHPGTCFEKREKDSIARGFCKPKAQNAA
jgi:hypothetical protein